MANNSVLIPKKYKIRLIKRKIHEFGFFAE